jgi:hypothetical protein
MRLLKLYLTRADASARDDDSIVFNTVPGLPDMIKVVVTYAATGTQENSSFSNSFVVSRSGAYGYVMSLVASILRDTDPFEHLQISSAMFPSVIYAVEELEDDDIRAAIQDIVYATLNTTIS